MSNQVVRTVYKDFNLNFMMNPISKDLAVLTNEKAIAQSLKNLMLTNYGEIPFSPEIGTNIRDMLFEPASFILTDTMKDRIITMIRNFEPRIELVQIDIKDNPNQNSYDVSISYKIITSNNVYTANISLDRLQ